MNIDSSKSLSNKAYDKYKRNPEARAFYKSAAWQKVRIIILQRDNYLCQECLKNNKLTVANTVHHIEPLLDNWDKGLDEENLEAICESCHNKEHPEKGSGKSKEVKQSKVRVHKPKTNREIV